MLRDFSQFRSFMIGRIVALKQGDQQKAVGFAV
jgi:hypothetical protein